VTLNPLQNKTNLSRNSTFLPQSEEWEPPELVSSLLQGNINVINAAKKKGVKKFVLVTSIGTGDSKDAPPEQVYGVLKPVLLQKEKAEQHLKVGFLLRVVSGLWVPWIGGGPMTRGPKAAHQAAKSCKTETQNVAFLDGCTECCLWSGRPAFSL